MYEAQIPQRPTPRAHNRNIKQNNFNPNNSQSSSFAQNTRRDRSIKPTNEENMSKPGSTNSRDEKPIDFESTCYTRDMMENCKTVDFMNALNPTSTKVNTINKMSPGVIWLETHSGGPKLKWLVDTGSPQSFLSQTTADMLTTFLGKTTPKDSKRTGGCRCLNQNIHIRSIVKMDLASGNSITKSCDIMVVPQKTLNLLGKAILQNLVI